MSNTRTHKEYNQEWSRVDKRQVYDGECASIQVLSRREAEKLIINEPHIMISIAGADLSNNFMRQATLSLDFDDVEYELYQRYEEVQAKGELPEEVAMPILMSDDHAKQIVDFLDKYYIGQLIVLHCQAGVSRSVGIAAALSEWMNGESWFYFDGLFKFHNKHCRRTMANALENDDRMLKLHYWSHP